jgi:hypothetical protein
VRLLDAGSKTASTVLGEDIKSFYVMGGNSLLTKSLVEYNGAQTIALQTKTPDKAAKVKTYKDGKPTFMAAGEYFRASYLELVHGQQLLVYEGNYPAPGSQFAMRRIVNRKVGFLPRGIKLNSDNRLIEVLGDGEVYNYDLENQVGRRFKIEGTDFKWLNEYLIYTTAQGQLKVYDFDGSNMRTITDVVAGFDVALSKDSKRIYKVNGNSADGFRLQVLSLSE